MKQKTLLLTILVLTMSIVGCGSQKESEEKTDQLQIITTFYPMYDFTTKITGDTANVSLLTNGEVDMHDYEPSAKDIAKIQGADVFIYNSKEMETWVSSVLASIDDSKVLIIEASKGIDLVESPEQTLGTGDEEHEEHEEEGHDHQVDPHIWLDPVLAKAEVTTIYDALVKKNPENKEEFDKNYESFKIALEKLDQDYAASFKSAENRTFVTQHAAFGYLANRYNLNQVSIAGLTPDAEPSVKTLTQLEDYVKKEKIAVIYVEQSGSSKMADTLASGTGAEVDVLTTLEVVSKEQVDQGEDYLSLMTANLKALEKTIK